MIAYFLPAILALGIITSYEDIKYGKIKNKWIILGLAYALIINITLITYHALTTSINTQYIIELTTNLIISILVGYAMWHYKIWSAGDGKLFIAFSALIPLTEYSNGYQQWFPAITLLYNTFIPGLIFMFFLIMRKIKEKNLSTIKKTLKETFNLKRMSISITYLFSASWIIQTIMSLVGINSVLISFAIMLIIYPALYKRLKNKMIYATTGISIMRLFIDKSIYDTGFIKNIAIMIIFWSIIIEFLTGSLSKLNDELFATRTKGTPREKNQETIPFAPFLFIGTIITLLCKGNILIYLKNLI